jgi:hypothetical protein
MALRGQALRTAPNLGFTVMATLGFLKKLPEEQQKEINYIGEQGRAKSVAADMTNRAKACDYSSMSVGDLARETVSNIPRSAGQLAESVVQPVLHPVRTYENLKALGKGVMQKLGVISGKDAAQYADAVGQFLADRYGSKDAILKTRSGRDRGGRSNGPKCWRLARCSRPRFRKSNRSCRRDGGSTD